MILHAFVFTASVISADLNKFKNTNWCFITKTN